MKAPVNAALLIGFIAALASSFEARADLVPDEIGVTVRAWHRSGANLNDSTQGVYALWDVGQWRDVRFSASVMALRLSNDRDGVGAGVVAEYGNVFAGLHLMHGYERPVIAPSIGVTTNVQAWTARLAYIPKPREKNASDAILLTVGRRF